MSEVKYRCVFQKDKNCPVRLEFKLKPESLVEFCKICPSKFKPIEADITSQIAPLFAMLSTKSDTLIEIQTQEKLKLMELVESLAQKITE